MPGYFLSASKAYRYFTQTPANYLSWDSARTGSNVTTQDDVNSLNISSSYGITYSASLYNLSRIYAQFNLQSIKGTAIDIKLNVSASTSNIDGKTPIIVYGGPNVLQKIPSESILYLDYGRQALGYLPTGSGWSFYNDRSAIPISNVITRPYNQYVLGFVTYWDYEDQPIAYSDIYGLFITSMSLQITSSFFQSGIETDCRFINSVPAGNITSIMGT